MAPLVNGSGDTSHLDFSNFQNVIGGRLVDSQKHRQGINPASRQPHHHVPIASQEDLDKAVEAARTAFETWSQTTFDHRKGLLLKFCDALETERAGFVKLLITEQGKPVGDPTTFLILAAVLLPKCHSSVFPRCNTLSNTPR